MEYVALINALLPLVSNLAPVVASLVKQIQGQTGMTVDEILNHADAALSEDQKALAEEAVRLQAEIDGGAQ